MKDKQQWRVGDHVKWSSQAQGTTKLKRGKVHAVVMANVSVRAYMSGISDSQWKFDTIYAPYVRYIIAVPRGGKSTKVDYYCPRPSMLQADKEDEHGTDHDNAC